MENSSKNVHGGFKSEIHYQFNRFGALKVRNIISHLLAAQIVTQILYLPLDIQYGCKLNFIKFMHFIQSCFKIRAFFLL